MNKFYGTGVALVTPFNADRTVDYAGLKNVINFVIDGGANYLVSMGTTGESATLSAAEKKEIWKFTAQTAAGRLPLVAGIGGNSTAEITDTLQKFDAKGYDAILSVSPYYNRPSQEGIYQHYKSIAAVTPLPLIVYNVPGRTGSNIEAATTLRLAHDFENIIGIKEASGNFEQFNRIVRDKPAEFLLISGDDPVTLPMMALGAVGVISVIGNAMPRQVSDMVNFCLRGDFASARALHCGLLEFTRLCFIDGSPGGVKAALKLLDMCTETLRLPLVGVSEETRSRIRAIMKK